MLEGRANNNTSYNPVDMSKVLAGSIKMFYSEGLEQVLQSRASKVTTQ